MRRYRAVAQQDKWGSGAACVASVLGIGYAEATAKLDIRAGKTAKTVKTGKTANVAKGPSGKALCRVLNEALKDTGLAFEIDGPFIGDANALETGSIVSLADGNYFMRAADGWMDPASGKIRPRLAGKVQQAIVLTHDQE
jgi:hypothetical protein